MFLQLQILIVCATVLLNSQLVGEAKCRRQAKKMVKTEIQQTAKVHNEKPHQPTLSEWSESGPTDHPGYQELPQQHSSVSENAGVKEASAFRLCLHRVNLLAQRNDG